MPSTLNPAIKLSAKRIINAFIISKNNPNVTMVTGRVRMTKMGLTKKFKRLRTMATIMAVPYESTDTWGRKLANRITAKALNKIRNTSFKSEAKRS